MWKQTRKHN